MPAGEMYSYLTGEPVSETIGKQRPYAIMINNIDVSLPQSGVSQAEMIYEAQVESGITSVCWQFFRMWITLRKSVLFVVPDTNYIDFANDNDAIYVHYGQSKYALARIEDDNIMTIHGLSGYESKVFYRSSDHERHHIMSIRQAKCWQRDLKSQALPEIIRRDIHRDCSSIMSIRS